MVARTEKLPGRIELAHFLGAEDFGLLLAAVKLSQQEVNIRLLSVGLISMFPLKSGAWLSDDVVVWLGQFTHYWIIK
jgi:hypothetical protein